jgi:Rrf2 family protein
MKLQISSRLAIFAILELASDPERRIAVAEIGKKCGVSSHHLAKVMHVLARAGLVRSVRGAGGGYRFVGNVRRTTLLDVIELFEMIGSNSRHEVGDRTDEGRALRRVLGEIDDITRATLGSITIATMLNVIRRRQDGRKASTLLPSERFSRPS